MKTKENLTELREKYFDERIRGELDKLEENDK